MILLGGIKHREVNDLGDEPAAPGFLRASEGRVERVTLSCINRKHCGAVLGTHIVALSVELARVVHREERIENHLSGDHALIERHGNGLGVTR